MEIILLERVEKLGQMGEIVSVKAGFARNYLVPQGKALRATKSNREVFEQRRAQLEASNLKHREQAEELRGKVDGVGVTVIRQAGEGGQLYGSVNPRDIAEAVSATGVTIERQQVRLDAALKSLGLHQVRVALHPEVDAYITVNVARTPEEAEVQADPELAAAAARAAEEAAAEEAAAGRGGTGLDEDEFGV
jgi:large subunit ribosomal protein L9